MANKTSKQLLTIILDSLDQIEASDLPDTAIHQSILATLPKPLQQQAKHTLMTLHFLFPHELLPALDLIDRKLIKKLCVPSPPSEGLQPESKSPQAAVNTVFYVQSASTTASSAASTAKSRFRNVYRKASASYDVRLDSWNCCCPAFAYSTLKLLMQEGRSSASSSGVGNEEPDAGTDASTLPYVKGPSSGDKEWTWLFGGLTTKEDAVVPICKHLLAVALVNAAPALFGNGMTSREVSKEEMAGWTAGWGEH